MIGPALRIILTTAAYGLMVLGFVRGIELIYPIGGPILHDVWRGVHHSAWAVVAGVVEGGVLLALLSIDKRIQNRDA